MTATDLRAGRRSLRLAALAAAAFAVATRPGPLGGLAVAAAAALAAALRVAPGGRWRALAGLIAALGPSSVAVAAFAPVAPSVAPVAALLVAAPFAAAGALCHARVLGRGSGVARAAALATVWCAVEAAWASPALAGRWAVPTLAVGTALVDGPGLALAGRVGMRGMSWAVIATGAALAELPRHAAAVALLAAVLLAWGGSWGGPWPRVGAQAGTPPVPSEAPTTLPVRLVQHAPTPPSIAAVRLDPRRERRHAAFLREHARGTADGGRLLIWPEAVLPRPWTWAGPSDRPPLVPERSDVLFGAATRREGGLFNSALLWHQGRLRIVRDKVRLVPVTEDALTPGVPRPAVRWRGRRVAALICWEAVFPGDARRAARAGADLLAILANDAYAGAGPVPRLHLRMARLRAAEVGLPTVFAQATGPSAAIGPDGRVLGRIEAGTAGSLDTDLPRASGATLYRRTGDLVGPGSTLASLLLVVRRLRQRDGARSRGGGA